MKSGVVSRTVQVQGVVPLAGTWVEMLLQFAAVSPAMVVPLAGTWVEIGFLISLENIAFIDHHNVFTRPTRA